MSISMPYMIGDNNKFAIIHLVRKQGCISKADVARILDLSVPAVYKNISSLIEANILTEVGTDETQMGRKPVLLRFNDSIRHVVGIDIGSEHIRGAVANMSGEIISSIEVFACSEKGADSVFQELVGLIRRLVDFNVQTKKSIAAISVATPSIVDSYSGNSKLTTLIESWDNINLKSELETIFNVPVILQNDVDADIIGEKWLGLEQNFTNILYVKYGEGLAARMILNNELYSGTNFAAGEIGYSLTDITAVRSRFHPLGVMEKTLCGDIYQAYRTQSGNDADKISLSTLLDREEKNEELAGEFVQKSIELLAVLLNNMVAMIDPQIVVLGGEAAQFRPCHLVSLHHILVNSVPFAPRIITSKLGKESGTLGSIRIALTHAEAGLKMLWK